MRDRLHAGKNLAWRVVDKAGDERLSLVAAGVAFYAFLAVFPALAAVISVWGLVSDPTVVAHQLAGMRAIPDEAQSVVVVAAHQLADRSPENLGWSTALSLLLTLWSANRGMKALLGGVAIAYEDPEQRSFARENALSLLFTVGAVVLALIALAAVVAVPPLLRLIGLGGLTADVIQIGRWPLLATVVLLGLELVYWRAPTRPTRWRWVTPGALVAVAFWLLASMGFSLYVENFSSFDETYGSVAAVAILLMWFYVAAFIVLLGAEINSVLERRRHPDGGRAARGAR